MEKETWLRTKRLHPFNYLYSIIAHANRNRSKATSTRSLERTNDQEYAMEDPLLTEGKIEMLDKRGHDSHFTA